MSVKSSISLLVRIWKICHPSSRCGFKWCIYTSADGKLRLATHLCYSPFEEHVSKSSVLLQGMMCYIISLL